MHSNDHVLPGGRFPASASAKARTIEAAIANERLIFRELNSEFIHSIYDLQEVKFAYGFTRNVPKTFQFRVKLQHPRDNFGQSESGEAGKARIGKAIGMTTALFEKPINQTEVPPQLMTNDRRSQR